MGGRRNRDDTTAGMPVGEQGTSVVDIAKLMERSNHAPAAVSAGAEIGPSFGPSVSATDLFDVWCNCAAEEQGRKHLWTLTEKAGGRDAICTRLAEIIRSHYDRLERIADDVARLGYEQAAEILRAALPRTERARSGDLGEILATELVEEQTPFRIPVRRLRYKDGREMALRGDDFIGAASEGGLSLLKGEAKSKKVLDKTTITQAREALSRHDGRCTPASLLFVANRLLESNEERDVELGRAIRDEVGLKVLRPDHMLFTVSGNSPPAALRADFDTASTDRNHYVVNLRVADHQEFIAMIYEEAQRLGVD